MLQGMVTDRDLRSAFPSSILDEMEREKILDRVQKIPVADIMSMNTVVLTTLSTLDDAFLPLRDLLITISSFSVDNT